MINGLITFGVGMAVLLYFAGLFVFASWVQDHCDRFPIAAPWLVTMMGLLIPISIVVGLTS